MSSMAQQKFDLNGIEKRLQGVIRDLPLLMGNEAVNFSKARFREQAWSDNTTEPWKRRRANKDAGRGILVKSGRLKRSIRIVKYDSNSVTIGTDVPYAKAHNEGFRGIVKQHVSAYVRNKTTFGITKKRELKRSSKIEFGRKKIGEINVSAHDRMICQNIPKRQFTGNSATLNRMIERLIKYEVIKALR